MESKTGFVAHAIESAQAAIGNLELRAGFLVVVEAALLVVVISGLAGNPLLALVRRLVEQNVVWYAALLLASFIIFAVALIIHIILTIRVILPIANPEMYITLGSFEPQHMYFLNQLDQSGRLTPSVSAYSEQLAELSDEELLEEYTYELMRVSYVRRIKGERFWVSLLFLAGLVIGLTVFGFLLALAGVLY